MTDCDKRISVIGIFSPCSSDTILHDSLINGFELFLNDTAYTIAGFELSYATKKDDFISRNFRGNKAVFNADEDFWKRIGEAEAVFIQEIRVRYKDSIRRLPAIVKYVR